MQGFFVFSVMFTDLLLIPIDVLFGRSTWTKHVTLCQTVYPVCLCACECVCERVCACVYAVMLTVNQNGLYNLSPLQHYYCWIWTASLHTTVTFKVHIIADINRLITKLPSVPHHYSTQVIYCGSFFSASKDCVSISADPN